MYRYEITKYKPNFRDEEYEDWTAISDIGNSYEGQILTIEKYKEVEDSYIKAIHLVMEYLELPFLLINNVVRSFSYDTFMEIRKDCRELYTKEILERYSSAKDLEELDKEKVDSFCRLQLREDIGATVYYPRRMKVYIGYDFLMGIHTSQSIASIIPSIERLGLFVEKH
ncbi:hypothetical protein H9647_24780 [Paenibacillus sp. Sa2BVA9]|uniref:Uncharacterized protein n=1 Tax=Paenibacillus gallinarum TaxID=2762232 RepID=A0ABR8T6R6_9BACL|nr:hypothetical protein [Paenibacillus gallinarum]